MQLHVVQSVDRRNFGGTQTTTGALYSSDAKSAAMNGWNSPHPLASSKKEPSDRSAAPAAKAQAQGRNFLWLAQARLRKSSRRGVNQSPILVIYQLLLKNNTKYWVSFWRYVRGGVFS